MIVNYGPASRIADNEILLRLKEVEDGRYEDTTRMSEIELELDGITSTVSEVFTDNDGSIIKSSELKQSIESIDSTVTNINEEMDTKIESKVTQAADSLSITFATKDELEEEVKTINATIDGIQMGGDMSITWDSLDEETKTKINDAIEASDAAWAKADAAEDDVASMEAAVQSNADLLDAFRYGSTTYIDGSKIYSKSIYADNIHLGGDLEIYKTEKGTSLGGYIGYTTSNLGGGAGMHLMSTSTSGGEIAVTTNGAAVRVGGTDNQIAVGSTTTTVTASGTNYYFQSGYFRPGSGNTSSLGSSSALWSSVYASNGTIQTSDENKKNSIEELPDKYMEMFDAISPKRYKLNDGTSGRYHVGFIAQDIEGAMEATGIDSQEFGGFVKDKDEDGDDTYFLRYDEFIGILAAKIKQLETRIEELEAR